MALLLVGAWSGWRTWRHAEGWPLGALLLGGVLGWWFLNLDFTPEAAATAVGFPLAAVNLGPGLGVEVARVSILGVLVDMAAGLAAATALLHGAWRCSRLWRGVRRHRYRLV
jgi:hypothetical protein